MTIEQLVELFEKYDEEFLQFDKVLDRTSHRPDLHAFVLLDKIIPGSTDIVSGAEHDEIFLGIDLEEFARRVTEEQIVELNQCGVRYASEYDCLAMFV